MHKVIFLGQLFLISALKTEKFLKNCRGGRQPLKVGNHSKPLKIKLGCRIATVADLA
jgi:hypothetical protein